MRISQPAITKNVERLADAGLSRRGEVMAGGQEIKMTVINVRDTLLAWYARRGYVPTNGDNRFGLPKRGDLHFVLIHRCL